MKPPHMAGLLAYFDCRKTDPLTVSKHLGYEEDPSTRQFVDLGRAEPVTIVSLLNRPYTFVPVEGDMRREFAEYGDRLRDARFLWLDARVTLTCGRDGSTTEGTPGGCDLITRTLTGEQYEVTEVAPDHGASGGLRGYLLLRAAT